MCLGPGTEIQGTGSLLCRKIGPPICSPIGCDFFANSGVRVVCMRWCTMVPLTLYRMSAKFLVPTMVCMWHRMRPIWDIGLQLVRIPCGLCPLLNTKGMLVRRARPRARRASFSARMPSPTLSTNALLSDMSTLAKSILPLLRHFSMSLLLACICTSPLPFLGHWSRGFLLWAAASIHSLGLTSLEWSGPLLHATPRPPWPCMQQRCSTLGNDVSTKACGERGLTEAPYGQIYEFPLHGGRTARHARAEGLYRTIPKLHSSA